MAKYSSASNATPVRTSRLHQRNHRLRHQGLAGEAVMGGGGDPGSVWGGNPLGSRSRQADKGPLPPPFRAPLPPAGGALPPPRPPPTPRPLPHPSSEKPLGFPPPPRDFPPGPPTLHPQTLPPPLAP